MLGIKPKTMMILPDGFIWVSLASVLKKIMRFDTVWAGLWHSAKMNSGNFHELFSGPEKLW